MRVKSPKAKTGSSTGKWLRRNALKAVIAIIAIAVVVGIGRLEKKDREAPVTPAPPVNVTVMTICAEPNLADTFKLPAVVEPNRVVTVSSEFEGRIEKILSREGSKVCAGDLLIQLNDDLIRPAYEMARAQADRDRIEYERMKNLVAEDATSQRDLDDATTRLAVSQAQLDEVTARLERTRILAPLSGVLNDLPVEEGEYVAVGAPVAEIVESGVVKVVVQVPERDIVFFDIGDEAEVRVRTKDEEGWLIHAEDGGRWLTGKITFISELADQQTRSTRMEITVPNGDGLARSGQIVLAKLTRRVLKDAVMVPLLAVIPMEEGNTVYVVNSGEAERREVELGGIIQGELVQVTGGVRPGDKLIIAGHRFVAPGQKVNIVETK